MQKPKFVICEAYLNGLSGHCYEYCISTAEASREFGFEPLIFGHKKLLLSELQDERNLIPWFGSLPSNTSGPASPTQKVKNLPGVGFVIHHFKKSFAGRFLIYFKNKIVDLKNSMHDAVSAGDIFWSSKFNANEKLSFGPRIVEAILKYEIRYGDHLFLPTLYLDELASICWALRDKNTPVQMPLIHVVLRRDPRESFLDEDRHNSVPKAKDLLKEVAEDERLREHLRFWSDTEELAKQYNKIPGLNVRVLPIPFRWNKIPKSSDAVSTKKSVLYLGEARAEKGYLNLPEIVRAVRQRYPDIQWIAQASGHSNNSKILSAVEELRELGVTLITEAMSPEKYYQTLSQADVVLLPYIAEKYLGRSSGIFAEAIAAGKPCVVPRDTWMGSQVELSGTGVTYHSIDEIGDAVCALLNDLERRTENTRNYSKIWTEIHSPRNLVTTLVQTI